jgi:large subunit ribosomal protein L22
MLSASNESLIITSVFANEGPRTKRFRPRARGRVSRISRRNSHVTIVLDDKEN